MIFITVGTQVAFDRMIRAIDEWASFHPDKEFFAQIGPAKYFPKNLTYEKFLSPHEFQVKFNIASLVIAHAGMGTIINALQKEKPLLIMPRKANLKEQRNDHQLATAAGFKKLGLVNVAMDENELKDKLSDLENIKVMKKIGAYASDTLIRGIREFINKN